MKFPRKLVLVGVALSIIPIALGIVSVVTKNWLNLILRATNTNVGTYGLFTCSGSVCDQRSKFEVAQGLLIAGVAAIAVGAIIALLLDIFIRIRWIHLLSQIFLFAGPTLLLIGLVLYAKYALEDSQRKTANPITLDIGYSMILIIIACILGFLTAVYFAFVAGFGQGQDQNHHGHHHSSIVVVPDRTQRF